MNYQILRLLAKRTLVASVGARVALTVGAVVRTALVGASVGF
jgi:hypothetical protein